MREGQQLAKLTRPRLRRVLPRQRLFDLLDTRRAQPVVWVVGPPGAGKTSLVASYVEARKLPVLWYDVDAGESDPATLFYFLRLAATKAPRPKGGGLALLTPEYLGDLPGFTRRFFEGLYATLPVPALVVLDNYQEIAVDSPSHAVIAQALARVPAGVNVVVISRVEPPPQCARHVANGLIAQVGFDDLRLTFSETSALAGAKRGLDDETLGALHAQADGWAAGTILMLERLDRTGALNHIAAAETMSTVFDYFAGQVFRDLPDAARDVLVRTSFLPHMTPRMAEQVSGHADAGKVLDVLHRRHLFTDRRAGSELTYRHHALFRAFLRAQARDLLSPDDHAAQCRRAATLLAAVGEPEHAVALYLEQGDWSEARPLIVRTAPTLMRQGRAQTIAEWIAALPPEVIDADPWLRFCQATCAATADPKAGRSLFERAHAGFVERGDAQGRMLSIAAIIETHVWEFEFASVRDWFVELEPLLADGPTFPSSDVALRVHSAFLMGCFYARPTHAALHTSVERIEFELLGDAAPNLKVTAGTFLLGYAVWGGDVGLEQRTIARIQPLTNEPGVTALAQVWWRLRLASHLWLQMHYRDADRVLDEARAIAEAHGLHEGDGVHCMLDMMSAAARGDAAAARLAVARVDAVLKSTRRSDGVYMHLVYALHAVMRNDAASALTDLEAAADIAHDRWFPIRYFVRLHHVLALIAAQRLDEARRSLDEMRSLVAGTGFGKCENEVHLLDAGIALSSGDMTRCRAALRLCLPSYRRAGAFGQSFRWLPGLLAKLLSVAIEADIESDHVRTLIMRADIGPPSPDVERWPWPLRVYTLGRFAVVRDGEAMRSEGKAQKKPLDLLKALIALGGRDVEIGALIWALWPDAGGDAQKSLEMTLSRLRRLLGRSDVVLVHEGKLTLDPRLVWVDIWAFERTLSEAIGPLGEVGDAYRAMRAFDLYKGRFLASEPVAAANQPTATRLQSKFIRLVVALGRRRESASWDEAARIYERGLEVDSLAEELYRRLMDGHRRHGRIADAMNVYRRCRDNLSIILGIPPSTETNALYDALRR